MTAANFGYCPKPLDWTHGNISVTTLPDLVQTVEAVASSLGVEGEWIYAPPARTRDIFSDATTEQPYSTRVFGLPQTHTIEHATGDEERLNFLVWCLSFLLGIRLTTTEAGFLDATPIKCGKLNEIVWCGRDSVAKALDCADRFWIANVDRPRVTKALTGIIHSYFLAQNPTALGFERFTYLYVALEGCHFVYRTSLGQNPRSGTHSDRIAALCSAFNRQVPAWADPSARTVVDRRNETLHEGLFFDEPLGFAGFGGSRHQPPIGHVPSQMEALVARLLVALLDIPASAYIQSPVNTRQRHGLTL